MTLKAAKQINHKPIRAERHEIAARARRVVMLETRREEMRRREHDRRD